MQDCSAIVSAHAGPPLCAMGNAMARCALNRGCVNAIPGVMVKAAIVGDK